jgi:hypothetical protein
MTGQDSPALYEDPSRISRMVVISCAVIAALLTFLMILPPLLSLLGHRSATPPHNEIDNAAPTTRTAAAASLDQLSRTAKPISPQSTNSIPLAGDVPADGDSSTAAIITETSHSIVSNGADTPQRAPQESPGPALAPTTNERSPEKPSTWAAATQPSDAGLTLEVEAEPVAKPPLPRVRPHHVTVASIAAIPLPRPRPSVPTTEAAGTDREAPHDRFGYDPL